MKKLNSIILFLFLTANQNLLMCNNEAALPGFLPDQIMNWKLQTNPEQYKGDDLFFLINGGADLFLEYGFVEVISAKYYNEDNSINVEIYQMEDQSAAFGIFTQKRYYEATEIEIGDLGSTLDSYLIFYKDKYTVIINGSGSSQKIQKGVMEIALIIESKIEQNGTKPYIVNLLPASGLNSSSIKYIEGILGLNSVYIFGYTNIFGFDECITAEYDDHKLFIMGYENISASSKGYENALSNFSGGNKFSGFSKLPDGTYFNDTKGKFISVQMLDKFLITTISNSEIDYLKIYSEIKGKIN